MAPPPPADAAQPAARIMVVGAGMGRTGTTSLQAALEILLGGRCYHMNQVKKNDGVPMRSLLKRDAGDTRLKLHCHSEAWLAIAAEGVGAVDLDRLFEGCTAVVDFPATGYYDQLARAFPGAKVVLSVRDNPQAWYESAWETIFLPMRSWIIPVLHAVRFWSRGGLFMRMVKATVWENERLFAGRFTDHDFALGVYERWIADVERTVPRERLLTYNVKQGWKPLCDFLGLPVPDQPFPSSNDKAAFKQRHQAGTSKLLSGTLMVGVPLIGACVAVTAALLTQAGKRPLLSLAAIFRRA